MGEQVLWINALVAVAGGALLLVAPKQVATLLGLPRAEQSFYPRMLGVTLLALASAIFAEGYGQDGLGIDGMALINLIGGGALLVLLLFGGLVVAKRGRWILRGITLLWLVLGALAIIAGY